VIAALVYIQCTYLKLIIYFLILFTASQAQTAVAQQQASGKQNNFFISILS
jgi:hypothetical protein